MIKLEICMGTACHLRGSRAVVETIQGLIAKNELKDKIDFCGKFCLSKCENKGVSISVNGKEFDVNPSETVDFFNTEILKLV